MKYIVCINRPYYPYIVECETYDEALYEFSEMTIDNHSSSGVEDSYVYIAEVLKYTKIKTHH